MKTKPAWLASLLATLLFLAPAIPAVGSTNSCGFTGLEMTNGICTDCTWHAIKADGSTWGASCQSNRWNLGQLRSTSIDLDDYVGCDDDAELDWISDGSFTDDLESGTKAKLVFDAANYNIKLEADLRRRRRDEAAASELHRPGAEPVGWSVGKFIYTPNVSNC